MHASLITLQSCPPREKDTRRAAFSAVAEAASNRRLSDNVSSVDVADGNHNPCLGAPEPAEMPSPQAAEMPMSVSRTRL